MKCGSCLYTDGCCYTSLPPKVKCNITGEFRYYDDSCNCEDIKASKAAEFDKFRELISKPGSLMAVNYDSDRTPSVSITGEEADVAYKSLLKLPLYGEVDEASQDDTDFWKSNAISAVGSTSCLICGEDIMVNMWDSYVKICPTCRRAVKFIKEKFKKELESYEMQ